jgi:hypothetical protein
MLPDLILRSAASVARPGVSKDGGLHVACSHPSRRDQVVAPQDEVREPGNDRFHGIGTLVAASLAANGSVMIGRSPCRTLKPDLQRVCNSRNRI